MENHNVWPQPSAAQWIWHANTSDDKNTYVYFRRQFDLVAGPQGLDLFITADSRYWVFLNGTFIGEGPPPFSPVLTWYDHYDLRSAAMAGKNCLAVVVHQVGRNVHNRGGLLAEVFADGRSVAATSSDWRCRVAAAWTANTFMFRMNNFDPYQEVYDARLEPAGWKLPSFDDSQWATGKAIAKGPWTHLAPRSIPMMATWPQRPVAIQQIEECTWLENRMRGEDISITLSQAGLPVQHSLVRSVESLISGDGVAEFCCSTKHLDDLSFDGVLDPCIVLDFGKVITAYVELDIEGADGQAIDMGVAERLIDGRFNNAIESQFASRYTMKAGRQVWRTSAWRGFRFLRLRFRKCFSPVKLHAARAIVTTYPFEEKGLFKTSDQQVQGVFDISRYTLRLCCHESVLDTPWREQAQWLGDVAAVTLGGLYACFGDTAMPEKFLRQSAATQRQDGLLANITNQASSLAAAVIPDYSLWWIVGLWNHYEYTGQRMWIDEYYAQTVRIVEAFLQHIDASGLLCDMPGWVFIDWAHVDSRGRCAPLNAILVAGLEAALSMARLRGDAFWADRIAAAIAGIRRAFVETFFDASRGVFVDANVSGTLSSMASEHANASAIRWGLCDGKLAGELARRIWQDKQVKLTEAQPFFTSVVLGALERVGRFDLAMQVIRERWGRRMVDRGATSTNEEWGVNGSWRTGQYAGFMRSLSHAWSACPAEFLIRNLGGIEIVEPGCRKVRVNPRSVDFDYELTFPTPLGPLHVRCQAGKVAYSAPTGVEVVRDDAN